MLIGVQELDASLLPTHLLPFPLLSVRLTSLRQRGAASQQEKDGKEWCIAVLLSLYAHDIDEYDY